MTNHSKITFLALISAFSMLGTSMAQATCSYYVVDSNLLNVRSSAGIGAVIIDVLEKNDVLCVNETKNVANSKWGFIKHKIQGGKEIEVKGWSHLRYAKTMTNAQFSAWADELGLKISNSDQASKASPSASSAAQPTRTNHVASTSPAPTAAPETSAATGTGTDVTSLRFTQPVPFGAWPVQGRTLKQLADSIPLFPPIEGLPDDVWKKNCTNCHKWNRDRLCTQGKTYVKKLANIFRVKHPFGGTYKKALMTWSGSGCAQ